ncbi:hypothetical protein [Clostridium sp. 2218st1_F5_2218SCRN_220325]|uniref:hypothetical protein n=1 Tax=Clostridium sp. 2218st1_F5_2218SCRN_220325 TaxID=3143056 RepID=UPI00319DAB0C
MRYTVMGFLQKGACELGLSMGDLAILRWFTDFKNSGKMITKTLKGDKYYWVSYEAITDEFPILNVKKDAIYRRLRRLCDAEILKKTTVYNSGTYSYFALGKNYSKLINLSYKNYSTYNKNMSYFDDDSIYSMNNIELCNCINEYDFEDDNFPYDHSENWDDNDFLCNENSISSDFDDLKLSENRVHSCANPVDLKPNPSVQKPNVPDQKPNIPVQKPDQKINLLNKSTISDIRAKKGNPSKSLSDLLLSLIRKNNPNFKMPNMRNWARTFDAILNFDHRDLKEVSELIKWIHTKSAFWSCQILNPSNLRKQYDRLICRKNYEENKFMPNFDNSHNSFLDNHSDFVPNCKDRFGYNRSSFATNYKDDFGYNHSDYSSNCKDGFGANRNGFISNRRDNFVSSHNSKNVENSIVINSIYGSYSLVGFEDI